MNLCNCAVPDEKNHRKKKKKKKVVRCGQKNNCGETYSSSNAVAPDPEERAVICDCLGKRSCDTACTYSHHQRKNKT